MLGRLCRMRRISCGFPHRDLHADGKPLAVASGEPFVVLSVVDWIFSSGEARAIADLTLGDRLL